MLASFWVMMAATAVLLNLLGESGSRSRYVFSYVGGGGARPPGPASAANTVDAIDVSFRLGVGDSPRTTAGRGSALG